MLFILFFLPFQIISFLIPLLDDKFPLIRSISCWTLSRFSKYIVQVGNWCFSSSKLQYHNCDCIGRHICIVQKSYANPPWVKLFSSMQWYVLFSGFIAALLKQIQLQECFDISVVIEHGYHYINILDNIFSLEPFLAKVVWLLLLLLTHLHVLILGLEILYCEIQMNWSNVLLHI